MLLKVGRTCGDYAVEGGKDERAKRDVLLIQNLEPGVTMVSKDQGNQRSVESNLFKFPQEIRFI